jgi:outer membrane lipoprotein carrier protein
MASATLSFILIVAGAAGSAGAPPSPKPAATTAAKPASPGPSPSPAVHAPAAAGKPPAAAASNPAIDKLVAKMQERYDSVSDYRARFTQQYTYSATGRERTSTGEILIKKPGRMRWNYEKPDPSLWLATGSTFVMYDPEAKQAFKQDLKASQLPAAVAFLMGKGKLSDEFEVSLAKELPYGNPDDIRLSLKPKRAQSTYRSIYFVVDPRSYLVRQSVLINAQGDINAITFTDPQLNTKIPDDTFRWKAPPGTREIEGGGVASAPAPVAPAPVPPPPKSPPRAR